MKLHLICFLVFCFVAEDCIAQAQLPHVGELIKQLDANADGFLTKTEVSKSQRYLKQFDRWDTDQNRKVTFKEIVVMRAKYGIATDGTMLNRKVIPSESSALEQTGAFSIPDIADLERIDRENGPSPEQSRQSAFILKTNPHDVDGEAYVILTDHTDKAYLESLGKLAAHHKAKILSCKNFAAFHRNPESMARVRDSLREMNVKYIAIAPRLETFHENTVLGVWELLTTLDEDPQLDCFPGFLVASNAEAFSRLIEQSIDHTPISQVDLKPFAINQVANARETRSLQKSGVLRNYFELANIDTPIVAIYGQAAASAPRLDGERVWNLEVNKGGGFIRELPEPVQKELAAANLVVMHGHGVPGMSCSLDVEGIPSDFQGKILLTGSCFSASPVKSDFPSIREAPGGFRVESRDAFVIRAIDRGAIVAFGHQRLSSGFPHLFPVLENFTQGQSVGQAYQQLVNGLIDFYGIKAGRFVVSEQAKKTGRVPQDRLLYILIGDPALCPLEPQPQLAF